MEQRLWPSAPTTAQHCPLVWMCCRCVFGAWPAWGHMICVLCCFLIRLGLRRTACQTTARQTWGFMGKCCSLGKKTFWLHSLHSLSVLAFASGLRKRADVIGHVGVGSGTMTHAWRISICFSILREFPLFLLCVFALCAFSWRDVSCLGKPCPSHTVYSLFYSKNRAAPLCLLSF